MDGAPDREASIQNFSKHARMYDKLLIFRGVRRRGIRSLDLGAGQTVLEVGCGTGNNFPFLQSIVGQSGTIIGVDQSAAMLEQAADRVKREGWQNVQLMNSPVEELSLEHVADKLLLSFTHDLLQTPAAVESALRGVRPDGKAVAICARWDSDSRPKLATKAFKAITGRYVTTFEGFDLPWRELARHLDQIEHTRLHMGLVDIVGGIVRHSRSEPEA